MGIKHSKTKKIVNYFNCILNKTNKEIRYLKVYTIISAIFSCFWIGVFFLFFFDAYSSFQQLHTLFYLLLPFIISLTIWLIGYHTSRKHPIITKFLVAILNISFWILYIFIVFELFIWMLFYSPEYTKLWDYKKALSSYQSDAVEHFPTKIPKNVKNIKLLRSSSSFTGDSTFYLKFDANPEYIKQETQKYKNTGKKYIIENKTINDSNNSNYFENGNYAKNVLDRILDNKTDGYTIRVIEPEPNCYRAIAIKGNTIIYILDLN